MKAVGYLGPEGTFSHLVARKRFGSGSRLVPCAGIYDVFEFIKGGRNRLGVLPLENSTGGTIFETIDCLVAHAGTLQIREELSLNVKLALVGRKGEPVRTLYSHYVPLQHCQAWIRRSLHGVAVRETRSTAAAAEKAASEPGAAALATRDAARRYGLDVLQFPVQTDAPNITEFIVVGPSGRPNPRSSKTSLLVMLENRPGSLFDFLGAFKRANVNLTRLVSRPIVGQPKSYLFVVDLQGHPRQPRVATALEEARLAARRMDLLGVYPVRRMYAS
ncbi:MAG: ACT domain-containing protein [Kiritimatiellae bacterium]|nr:ACT domain-containing protein [Kiritimatiellia bacterium]MDW8459511.1 prephenate dehydratase domain-containing protein [Verrucomicrobiota bacterium]